MYRTKGRKVLEEEAFVRLQMVADAYLQVFTLFFKPYGISPTQYNVLRILRGAGKDGLPSGEIGARMITRDPDMTRMLDRLEARHLVTRERLKTDRRVVVARISEQGLALVDEIDGPLVEMHRQLMGKMPAERLELLIELLDEARDLIREWEG